jgi:hypothetical protein
MPSGFAPVRIDVPTAAPRPRLELQAIVKGEPIHVLPDNLRIGKTPPDGQATVRLQ